MMRTRTLLVLVWWGSMLVGHALARDVQDVPNPRTTHHGWVSDEANVLGQAAADIERRLDVLHTETGQEVAIVILDSIDDAPPRVFANALFNAWHIGRAGVDDGVLVLHVLDQRRIEIETGYGVEGRLPDAKCAWLIHDVALPQFRAGELARGHLALSYALDRALRDGDVSHDALIAETARYTATLPSAPAPRSSLTRWPRFDVDPSWWRSSWALAALALAVVSELLMRRSVRRYSPEAYRTHVAPGCMAGFFTLAVTLLALSCARFARETVYQVVVSLAYVGVALGNLAVVRDFDARARKRSAARSCRACGRAMQRADDATASTLLSAGQRAEMRLGSVFYDVWCCDCGAREALAYDESRRLDACPDCHFHTLGERERESLREPTPELHGIEETRRTCQFCERQDVVLECVLWAPPRSSSSARSGSSSSSSSGSSSSSSFGGGSSGGGGAGGSY